MYILYFVFFFLFYFVFLFILGFILLTCINQIVIRFCPLQKYNLLIIIIIKKKQFYKHKNITYVCSVCVPFPLPRMLSLSLSVSIYIRVSCWNISFNDCSDKSKTYTHSKKHYASSFRHLPHIVYRIIIIYHTSGTPVSVFHTYLTHHPLSLSLVRSSLSVDKMIH